MSKKLFVVLVLVLVLMAAAVPAMAQGGAMGNAAPVQQQIRNLHQVRVSTFSVVGSVTAVGEDSITVLVASGSRQVKPYVGEELTVVVNDTTRFMQWTVDGSVPITFADVSVGDSINVHGLLTDGVFVASRVTVDVPMSCTGR